jgi:trehalose-phosphatase
MAKLAQAPSAALLLDYDGTLAPFSQRRDRALPYPGVSSVLADIMEHGRTRVVIVTGRPAAEIVRLLGIHPCPEIWGLHGLQRLKPDGSCELSSADAEARRTLVEASSWLDRLGFRNLAEYKPGSIAVHWRGVPELVASNVRSKVLLNWMSLAFRPNMELLEFDGGVEIRLAVKNKADAVRTVLEESEDDAVVAYLADEQNDELAFRALQPRGLAVLVRPQCRPTVADLWLQPPRELLGFLTQWRESRLPSRGRGRP